MGYIKCGFKTMNNIPYHDLEECGDERCADDILLGDSVGTKPATETAKHPRAQSHVVSLGIQHSNLHATKQRRSVSDITMDRN